MWIKKQQLEPYMKQWTGSKLGKEYDKTCHLFFNLYTEHTMSISRLDELQAGIKIAGRNINNLRYADDTILMAEREEELKNLFDNVEGREWKKKQLKTQY